MYSSPIFTRHFEALDSTQSEASRQIRNLPSPFFIMANTQSGGRGRQGRTWYSPKGNYYSTLVIDAPQNPADAPKLSFVAALALLRALEGYGVTGLSLKWPNDVLMNEQKIAGILLEAQARSVLIGVGVNLAHAPLRDDLPERAIEPAIVPGNISTDAFHNSFDAVIVEELNRFAQFGFAPFRRAFAEKLWARRELLFDDGAATELVKVTDIDESGALIIKTLKGEKKIYAGDLWPI